MKIEKLKIKNFRCYEDIELELKEDYTVLVGINGAGKTTVLDAISIALGGYIQILMEWESMVSIKVTLTIKCMS